MNNRNTFWRDELVKLKHNTKVTNTELARLAGASETSIRCLATGDSLGPLWTLLPKLIKAVETAYKKADMHTASAAFRSRVADHIFLD